jgi:hypothetical protein
MKMEVIGTKNVYKETVDELYYSHTTHKTKDNEDVIDNSVDKMKKDVKCRYNDRGYCSQSECVFLHSNIICDKVLSNGKCPASKECLLRHPKDCKHWMGDTRGCLRGDRCKYLHQLTRKGMFIKLNKNSRTKSENQDIGDKQELFIEKVNDDNVIVLKEDIASKEEVIKRLEENNSKLISENKTLLEENNRFQRILLDMNQEIKLLRARTQ